MVQKGKLKINKKILEKVNLSVKKVEKASQLGRWPANIILTVPEDKYVLRDDVSPRQLHSLARWLDENA